MTKWIFVRHGQSIANRDGWYSGSRDTTLTDVGRLQAQRCAFKLQQEGVQRILCSDLSRAEETATIIADHLHLPCSPSPSLRERKLGLWEGLPRNRFKQYNLHPLLTGWETAPVEAESLRAVAKRATSWLAGQEDTQTTLIVSHGGVLRALVGLLDGVPTDKIGHWAPGNCHITVRLLPLGTWSQLTQQSAGPS